MASKEKRTGGWWRRGLVLLVGLAVLAVAAALVIPRFIPWDRVKTQAEEKISAAVKRRVTIGRVGFQVWRGFEIRDLRIDNAPGFSQDPFFTDDVVSVQYRLWPLLLGRVVLKSIRFEKPRLLVERRRDGQMNISDWISSRRPDAEPATPAARSLPAKLPVELLVSEFSLVGADLTFRDQATEYRVSDMNLSVSNLTLAGLTPVTVELKAAVLALDRRYPVEAKLIWRFNYAEAAFRLDQAEIRLPGANLAAAGTVDQALSAPQVHVSGKLDVDWAAVQKDLLPAEVADKLPPGMRLAGATNLTFNCNGPAAPWTELKVDVADDSRLTIQRDSLSLLLALKGTAELQAGRLKTKRTLQGEGIRAELALALDDLAGERAVDATWNGTVDLAGLQKFLAEGLPAPSGHISLEAHARGPLASPRQMDFSAEAQAKDISVRAGDKALLERLDAQVSLRPTQLKISRLSAQVAGQALTATLHAEKFDLREPDTLKPGNLAAKVQWTLSGKVLDVDALLALVPSRAAAAGTTPAAATAEEEAPEPDARAFFPARLDVSGRAQLDGVRFGNVKLGAVDLEEKLKDRVLTLKGSVKGYDGSLKHETRLDAASALLGYAVSVRTERVDLEPMLNDLLDTFVAAKLKKPELLAELKDKFAGRLSGTLDLSGRGIRRAQARPNLAGKGRFELRDGRIRKFDFQDQLAQWFGSEKFKQDIPFERADLDFTLAKQVVTVNRFVAESGPTGEGGDLRLTANGTVTFAAAFRDFKLQPRLHPRAAQTLSPELSRYAEVLKDEKGWVTVPARLNGPVSKPDVKPDWDWIKGQAGSYVQKKSQAAAQEAQQKINSYVEQQKGKSAQEVKDNAAKELEKAKEQLKKLNLQNIFK